MANASNRQEYGKTKIPTSFQRMMQPALMENAGVNHSNPKPMITKVTAKPNPFYTSVTLEVSCEHSRHTIVRMSDPDGKIVKLFSWYLVKGSNLTTITEMSSMSSGGYSIDILDNEGNILFNTSLTKA